AQRDRGRRRTAHHPRAAADRHRADPRGHPTGRCRADHDRWPGVVPCAVWRLRAALRQPRRRRRSPAARADSPAPRVVKRAPRPGPELFGADPVTASSAVAEVLALHGITDEVRAARVCTEWAELVGPKIAQRTRPDGVTDRTLWVEV